MPKPPAKGKPVVNIRSIAQFITFSDRTKSSIFGAGIVKNTLTFTETIKCNIHRGVISDTLVFNSKIESPVAETIKESLTILQAVKNSRVIKRSVSDILSFGQITARARIGSVTQLLILSQATSSRAILDILTLNETIIYSKSTPTKQTITFNETFLGNQVKKLGPIDTLVFIQGVSGYRLDPQFNQTQPTYHTVVCPPNPVVSTTITLSCGASSVTLRNPEFGNDNKLDESRVLRRNRGNEIDLFRDPIWPKTKTITFSFRYLKYQDILNLLSFMNISLGKQVTLIDFYGNSYQGIIINPNKDYVTEGRGDHSATFDLQLL